jgi:hypothetical protein
MESDETKFTELLTILLLWFIILCSIYDYLRVHLILLVHHVTGPYLQKVYIDI